MSNVQQVLLTFTASCVGATASLITVKYKPPVTPASYEPEVLVTIISPVEVPPGNTNVTVVELTGVKVAAIPSTVTLVKPPKLVPVNVIVAPLAMQAEPGLMFVTVGGAQLLMVTVNAVDELLLHPVVVFFTVIVPLYVPDAAEEIPEKVNGIGDEENEVKPTVAGKP